MTAIDSRPGKRAHLVLRGDTAAKLRGYARQHGMTMGEALDRILADLPPTPAETELTRLASDPAFAAGDEPSAPKRAGRKARR